MRNEKMKKKFICTALFVCILLSLCVLPSSANGEGAFRTAVIIDSADIAGFSENTGVLHALIDVLEENEGVGVTFYIDIENTQTSTDLTAALMYFKVNGFRVGLYGNDEEAAVYFNNVIKYVIKGATRLLICEVQSADAFKEKGYSVITKFDISFTESSHDVINMNAQGDTFVKTVLDQSTVTDIERLIGYALPNGISILGANEKKN